MGITQQFILMVAMLYVGEARKIDSLYMDKYELSYYNDGDDSVPFCEALVACSVLGSGSRLVKVNEEDTQKQMDWMLEYWGYPRVWIGATDMRSEGVLYWLDGTSFRYGYTKWDETQPQLDNTYEECATYGASQSAYPDGVWHDYPCSDHYGYVCQRDISTRSLSPDSSMTPYSTIVTSFANAQKECKSRGARIARAYNGRYEEILQLLPKDENTKFWIQDESSDSGCAVMSYNRWQTHECNEENFGFICEIDEESVQA
ncbi:low affinity immunoglobulin epsilon Fc receptor-like [Styela clava]